MPLLPSKLRDAKNVEKGQQEQVQINCKLSLLFILLWKQGGLVVSALPSGSDGLGSSPGRGHCVVLLGKILYSDSASLYPAVQMGTSKFNAGGNPAMD